MKRPADHFHGFARLGSRLFRGRFGQVPDDLPDADEAFVRIGDDRLGYLRWPSDDDGPPLVLLHGLCQNPWIWWRFVAALDPRPPVLALGLPGHGPSSQPGGGFALAETARVLAEALTRLCPDSFDLVGHSWGGKVATVLASAGPDRVRRLVLMDPVPPAGLGPVLRAAPGLLDLAFGPERRRFDDEAGLMAGAGSIAHLGASGALDAADLRVWRGNYAVASDGGWCHRLPDEAFRDIVAGALEEDIRPRLDALACPTLVLLPTFTVSFWPGSLLPWRRLPSARIARVWGDHSFLHTNPFDAAEAVGGFLAEGAEPAE